jgi:hypothetical protein
MLHRKVGRLFALEDAVDISRRAPVALVPGSRTVLAGSLMVMVATRGPGAIVTSALCMPMTLVGPRRFPNFKSAWSGRSVSFSPIAAIRMPLVRGETGVVLLIAPDQRQAKIALDYCRAALEQSPILKQLIESRSTDALQLTNGICIEVRAASFRRLRGPTYVDDEGSIAGQVSGPFCHFD